MEDAELYAQSLYKLAVEAAVAAVNAAADEVYQMSQIEVPKGYDDNSEERYGQTLEESGRGPFQDPGLMAIPEKIEAVVVYDQPYAHAVHEGWAMMSRATGEVLWAIKDFTTEGTKDHYLEDPLKAVVPKLELMAGVEFETRLGLL